MQVKDQIEGHGKMHISENNVEYKLCICAKASDYVVVELTVKMIR